MRRRTDTVAFVVAFAVAFAVAVEQDLVFREEPCFSAVVRGAIAGLADRGIPLLPANAQSQRDRDRLTAFLRARHVDGPCSVHSGARTRCPLKSNGSGRPPCWWTAPPATSPTGPSTSTTLKAPG
ncbi:hypothetical protein ACFWH4_33240 [Streptomyces sp. NPDC127091]|uniref:hypothetical protein n=1 Tax=Streptomyces sp. NPDC127091 TaxID=3347134 RepID=UPI00365A5DEC